MSNLADIIETLAHAHADLERRVENMQRHGTVAEVDPATSRVRLKIGGTDEAPMLSPWVRPAQMAGALKVHALPSVGQTMTLFSPGGEMAAGVAVPFTWSNANAAPSQSAEENVLTFGSVRIELTGDGLKITAGGTVLEVSGEGVAIEGDDLTHNGIFIGDTHQHTQVEPGGALSGPPPGD
ncbi:phage baseplate assembly protein V [Pseudoxanthobacter sp. M-2]|uniref:phage baseplate assembly protein V n=1 Tax=Pseudoxanthobacter sp. M-2 TaxID=3078754 RepID=UPI0038FC2573